MTINYQTMNSSVATAATLPAKAIMLSKFTVFTRLAILLMLCLFCTDGIAQLLTGKIVDQKGAPLKYANVALLKAADSSLVTGKLTDNDGKFSIATPEEGNYFLKITSLGFTETSTPAFRVTGLSFNKDFPVINMNEQVKTLKEVSVNSMRPLITQLPDRMVVTIEGTALAAGNTAFDVLTKAPGVFIDQDGNIQLNGRSGITVMLDGRLTYLSARDLRTMLESMSAENIKNIEVITNPSSKYDAEGTAGILNINLKKNNRQGMNGSIYSGYNYNFKQHGGSAGGNLNWKTGKWNSLLTLDFTRRVGGREATFTRIFYGTNQSTYFDQFATGNFVAQGPPAVRAATDYSINDRNIIGFMVNYTHNTSHSDFLTETYIGNAPGDPQQFIDADNFGHSKYQNLTLNGHYNKKLDTLGSMLSADFDYVKIKNTRTSDFFNYYTDLSTHQITKDFLYTRLPAYYDIYSGKIDFTKNFSRGRKLELGLKASQVVSDNDARFYFNNSMLVPDPLRSNHFNYREKIFAGYANWNSSISKKLALQAGLRIEHTNSKGISYTINQLTERAYTNLFPSIFLQHKVSDNYGITYSYSRRLLRPNYGNLNPFRFYRDPYTWEQGNPYLRPQYTHAFSINQAIKKIYSINFVYQFHEDVVSELPILNADSATTIYTTGNVNDGQYASLTGVIPVRIMKGWDVQNTVNLSYNKLAIMVDKNELVNDRVSYFLQSNHTIQLPKSLGLKFLTGTADLMLQAYI